MTKPLTIQLPPNLEQQMLYEAQKQNTTLEHLILRSLQKDYGNTPDRHSASISFLEDFFNAIRNAIATGQPAVQVPVNDLSLTVAESLKRTGILLDFQTHEQTLTLQINPAPPPDPVLPNIDPSELDPETAKILKDIVDDDPNVRAQAIQSIRQWYEQQS